MRTRWIGRELTQNITISYTTPIEGSLI